LEIIKNNLKIEMKRAILLAFLALVAFILVFVSLYNIEGFAPWFGYEPGLYGPGWGRKEC